MTYMPYVWLLLITAIINGGLAYYTQRYNDAPSAKPFRFMMWNAAIWSFLYGVSASTDIFSFKLFIINLIYIPAQLAALAALALALEYTWQGSWLTRQRLILLLIPPVFFVIFAFTSQSHQLWRYDYQLIWSGAVSVIVASKGLVYWAYIAYMLGLALSAFAILVISIRQRIHLARNILVLSIGVLIPTIVGALYVFGLTPVRGFDWTSSSFVVMGLLYIWVVTRGRLFDFTPLARKTLVEYLEDLMIILSPGGLINDFNRAAQTVLALSPATMGAPATGLSEPWGRIFQRHAESVSAKEEIAVNERFYELTITPILIAQSRLAGKIFLFRDITERKQAEDMERKQRNLAEALRDTSQALTSTLDYNSVLDQILKNVERVVPTDSANIALLDEEGIMHYVHFHGYEEHQVSLEEIRTVSFSIATSRIFKTIYETNEPYIISDTHSHPDWIIIPSGAWIRSYAGMPIRVHNKVIGFLNLDSSTPGMYTPEHLENLRAFADQAAVAVENARLFSALETEVRERKNAEEKTRYQNKQLSALHQIFFDLLKHRELDDLLDTILIHASELLESPYGLLGLIEGDALFTKATTEMNRSQLGIRIPIKNAQLSARAIETGEIQVVQDYFNFEGKLKIHDTYKLKAVLNFPIAIDNHIVGILALGRTQPNKPFTADEFEVMKSMGQLAALALDNAQLLNNAKNDLAKKIRAEEELRNANQILQLQIEAIEKLRAELREQAIRDPLTGLYNRRYLAEIQDRELAHAHREGYPVGFAMIDIDHFKRINDTFGHSAGDIVLQKLATLLMSQTRIGDIVCRYGGEEFLVILPNTTAENTSQIAERWRTSFIGTTLPLAHGSIHSTISCGISLYPIHGDNGEDLISLADKALYQAKTTGRNRVVIWQSPEFQTGSIP